MRTKEFKNWQRMIHTEIRMHHKLNLMPGHSEYIKRPSINYALLGKLMAMKIEQQELNYAI